MTDERSLVALLYRADWARLSLTAEVRGLVDVGLQATRLNAHLRSRPVAGDFGDFGTEGVRRFQGQVRISPGGRCRAKAADPFAGVSLERCVRDELLRPAKLLSGYTLTVRGPVTVAGRDGLDVIATPGTWWAGTRKPGGPVEAVVDAETGMLLRRTEIFEGQPLSSAEIVSVRFGAADAASAARSRPTPSDDDDAESNPFDALGANMFTGSGWRAAKAAANLAGSVAGTAVRHSPRRGRDAWADGVDGPAAMPADEPFGDGVAVDSVSDELVYALYRSGTMSFRGTLHQWADGVVLTGWLRSGAARRGLDGVGAFVGAVGDRAGDVHRVWRIRTGSGGRYRIDYLLKPYGNGSSPASMACDGRQRWREYENRLTVGPAGPVDSDVVTMVDASWLLQCELSELRELTFGGRRAFAFRVKAGRRRDVPSAIFPDTGVVVDAELGVVLLTVSRVDGKPAIRREFRDVAASADSSAGSSSSPAGSSAGSGEDQDGAFLMDVAPGVRVIHHDGGLLNEIDVPEPVRTAARTAGTAARMTGAGVTAAKGFLDSLRRNRLPER